jgi:hypothetical protein
MTRTRSGPQTGRRQNRSKSGICLLGPVCCFAVSCRPKIGYVQRGGQQRFSQTRLSARIEGRKTPEIKTWSLDRKSSQPQRKLVVAGNQCTLATELRGCYTRPKVWRCEPGQMASSHPETFSSLPRRKVESQSIFQAEGMLCAYYAVGCGKTNRPAAGCGDGSSMKGCGPDERALVSTNHPASSSI